MEGGGVEEEGEWRVEGGGVEKRYTGTPAVG